MSGTHLVWGCIKAYHPSCIGKKNKVLKSEGSWICHRHSCAECGGPPQFYCLACPDSVCRLCVGAYEFVRLKLDKGLCKTCFELALLAEKNAEIDSEGEKLDFQDPTTDEFLFKEYLLIIMEQEELTFDDLHHAYSKRENYNSGSDYDKNKDKDDVISISDADNCSDYASDDSFDKIKRSRKKREPKNKLCDLLKSHFANTLEPSILDGKRNGGESRSVNEDEQIISECKRPRTLTPYKVPIKVEYAVRKSCYASVVVENIKLVYLRRSLVEELLMHPDTFEEKVVGSFVRVKRKPGNCLGMTSFQLLLVTGVKKTSNAESNKGILLEVSCMPVDIPIDMLNDDDISEISDNCLSFLGVSVIPCVVGYRLYLFLCYFGVDMFIEECIDLQQRIKDGIIKRPTVVELEQKAKSLHEDITKHKPSEQQRLLQKLPRVIAEEVEVKRTADRNYSGNNCPTGFFFVLCLRLGRTVNGLFRFARFGRLSSPDQLCFHPASGLEMTTNFDFHDVLFRSAPISGCYDRTDSFSLNTAIVLGKRKRCLQYAVVGASIPSRRYERLDR
ncbi:hypothetical protein GOBAR_DD25815 [Gossypium barbadense]|nr:hypothetical protein GOBAR_DD25815 [Gossypium barbadense]